MLPVVFSRSSQAARWAVATVLLAATAGCGGASPGTSATTSIRATDVAPGAVALAYMRRVARGEFASAATYVVPSQRGILDALALGTGPGTSPRVWGDVSVGRQVVSGDVATVSLVGRLCRMAAATGGRRANPECIEERDVRTSSPLFLVHLARTSSAGWRVTFYPERPERPR